MSQKRRIMKEENIMKNKMKEEEREKREGREGNSENY
jgi:hypothetical protein